MAESILGEGRCVIVSVVLVLHFMHGVGAQYSMRLDLSHNVLPQGSQMEAVCEITNWISDRNLFIVWLRRSPDGEEIEISTSEHVNDVFAKTGRYNATCEKPEDYRKSRTVIYRLTITNVKSSDSGEYICRFPNNLDVSSNFTVVVPVQSVRLSSQAQDRTLAVVYTDGEPVIYAEGIPRHMFCDVTGGYPEPIVRVYVDDTEITSLFTSNVRLVRDPGSRELHYSVKLTNDYFIIDHESDNKTLRCVASDPLHVLKEMSASILLKIAKYAPIMTCYPTEIPATLHQVDVSLPCVVRSQPPVTKTGVTFLWPRLPHRNTSINAGQRDGHYYGDLLPGRLKSERIMVLNIGRVFPQHFRTYYFTARNEIGSAQRQLTLHQSGYIKAGMAGPHRINPIGCVIIVAFTLNVCLDVISVWSSSVL